MSTRYCDSATTRELVGLHKQAVAGSTNPAVTDTVVVLRHALDKGDAFGACLLLQRFAPHDLTGFDAELYGAAISLASALWHVETGTDATAALDAAQAHLNAALDAHRTTAGAA